MKRILAVACGAGMVSALLVAPPALAEYPEGFSAAASVGCNTYAGMQEISIGAYNTSSNSHNVTATLNGVEIANVTVPAATTEVGEYWSLDVYVDLVDYSWYELVVLVDGSLANPLNSVRSTAPFCSDYPPVAPSGSVSVTVPSGPVQPQASSSSTVVKKLAVKKKPKIVGVAKVGRTLRVRAGKTKPKAKVTYQWYMAGYQPIAGATGKKLKLTLPLKGKKIYVVATYSKVGYNDRIVRSKRTRTVRG